MKIRDRIIEFRRVPAKELQPDPRNWRRHPKAQADALRGVLAEIGYAGAALARKTPEGGLMLVDGHLRAETDPSGKIPCLILDVTAEEAAKLMATLDPLAAMAVADVGKLDSLLKEVETDSDAVREMLADLAKQSGIEQKSEEDEEPAELASRFAVIVECETEEQQLEILKQLEKDGLNCRALVV